MKKLNFIFVGGKKLGYESLNFLLKKNYRPLCVLPNKDDKGFDNSFNKSIVKLAKSKKIKITNLKSLINFLKKYEDNLDVIFCLGSTRILPQNIVMIPKMGTLNIHPSLLPKYRGRYSLVHSIANGEKYAGLTSHWIGKEIDLGEIISKKKIIISKDDTGGTLYNKFTNSAIKEFKKIFSKIIERKKIKTYKQKKGVTRYKNKHFPNNGKINWNWSGNKIYNFLRSMIHEPFPPPEIKIGSQNYYLVSKNLLLRNKIIKSPK
mgnify:CR=1 FL=1|tara:strand:+ start:2801 stop:3586 length:786 start_codon:yes stop_codon:yes gene_type:complete